MGRCRHKKKLILVASIITVVNEYCISLSAAETKRTTVNKSYYGVVVGLNLDKWIGNDPDYAVVYG